MPCRIFIRTHEPRWGPLLAWTVIPGFSGSDTSGCDLRSCGRYGEAHGALDAPARCSQLWRVVWRRRAREVLGRRCPPSRNATERHQCIIDVHVRPRWSCRQGLWLCGRSVGRPVHGRCGCPPSRTLLHPLGCRAEAVIRPACAFLVLSLRRPSNKLGEMLARFRSGEAVPPGTPRLCHYECALEALEEAFCGGLATR